MQKRWVQLAGCTKTGSGLDLARGPRFADPCSPHVAGIRAWDPYEISTLLQPWFPMGKQRLRETETGAQGPFGLCGERQW